MGEKDLLDLLDGEEEEEEITKEDLDDLKKEIENLKKENQGLLSAKQDEKRKRQQSQTKLQDIESKIDDILESKGKTNKVVDPTKGTLDGVPLDFTEDGTAFVPKDKLDELLKPAQEKIKELESSLASAVTSGQASIKADRVIRDVLSEDERYPSVYNTYKKARMWVEQQVVNFQEDNNLEGLMSSGQALDIVFTPEVEKEFTEKFEGMDLEATVLAEDSERLFRRMLKTNSPEKDDEENKRFKKVLDKPNGLSDSLKSAKKGELSVFDKLEDLSNEDILSLSDKQVEAIEKSLLEEEQRG